MPTLRGALSRIVLPFPVKARHAEYSLVVSADDESGPSERLLDVGLAAAQRARSVSLEAVSARMTTEPRWPDLWPGEHYRLLAALVEELQPRVVLDIGTATGLSALSLLARLPEGGQVHTFDLFPWNAPDAPPTDLRESDFADGRLVQHLDDLSSAEGAAKHRDLLKSAELIFIDAAKDGAQELNFLQRFEAIGLDARPIIVFDDIRQWKMLATWRRVTRPKLDLTSFGHWTGTGLVDFG